jgi:hypothetical protein
LSGKPTSKRTNRNVDFNRPSYKGFFIPAEDVRDYIGIGAEFIFVSLVPHKKPSIFKNLNREDSMLAMKQHIRIVNWSSVCDIKDGFIV